MIPSEVHQSDITYRLVIVRSTDHSLAATRETGRLSLPRVIVSRKARQAQQLQRTIEELWGIRSVILDVIYPLEQGVLYAIAETLSADTVAGLVLLGPDEITGETIPAEDYGMVADVVFGRSCTRGPLCQLGWVGEAQHWIQENVGGCPYLFPEDVYQLNAAGGFMLVHFRAQRGRGYWLKATGAPNTHEFAVTLTLARLFPKFLPILVAARKDWNAWVTEDAGNSLRAGCVEPVIERAVAGLANLQLQTTDYISDLLIAGCADQRNSTLLSCVPEITEFLLDAMRNQKSTEVPRLEDERILEIGTHLKAAYEFIDTLRIPNSVVHNDINIGNLLYDGARCVITDWAEACVGNPFVTFEQLSLQLAHAGVSTRFLRQLRAQYNNLWRQMLPERAVESVSRLAPLLAAASFLFGRGDWLYTSRRDDLSFQSHARTLTRSMDRVLQNEDVLEVLCR
jgi:hypothetical protein